MTPEERDAFIVEHLPIVDSVVNRLKGRIVRITIIDREDLVQAGVIGLLDAERKYRSDRGTSFSTYSRYRIAGEVLDCIRKTLRPAGPTGTKHKELNEETIGGSLDGENTARLVLVKELRRVLPPLEDLIIGHLLDGYSLPETAELCNISETRANYLKYTAYARMREQLAKR